MDTLAKIKSIRKSLKTHPALRKLLVRKGPGTSSGWCKIWGSLEGSMFTEGERAALKSLGLSPGGNLAVIQPESLDYWVAKLGVAAMQRQPCRA